MLTAPNPYLDNEYVFVPVPKTNLNYPIGLRSLKNFYDRFRSAILQIRIIRAGWKVFQKNGETPRTAFAALITLFCLTRGVSNAVMHFFIKRTRKKYVFRETRGFLGDFTPKEIKIAAQAIKKDGYYVFPKKLAPEIVRKLRERMENAPATTDFVEGNVHYDPKNVQYIRYMYGNDVVLGFPEVQELIADPSLLAVGQEYLGCAPLFDLVTMAINTSVLNYPSEAAAQLYHFDMDRIRWLKIFVYLSDVTEESGPTCYIKGSHRPFSIPYEILRNEYKRLPDDYVAKFFSPDRFIKFTGESGMIFAFDSMGLHKGLHFKKGTRSVLQFEFVNHLFGACVYRTKVKTKSRALIEAKKKYPSFYEIMDISPE